MDVEIVNPHEMIAIDEIEPQLLKTYEDLVFISNEYATECMLLLTTREKDLIKDCKKRVVKPLFRLKRGVMV